MARKREPPRELLSAEDQFGRCMSDNPEYLANKARGGLTYDEIAELRCRKESCFLMKCMAEPARLSPYKRNALTGEVYYGQKCSAEQDALYSCIAREKKSISDNLKAGRTVVE